MNVLKKSGWLGFLVILVWAGQLWSEEIRLRADGTGDYVTIQEAIGAAFEGDEIVLEEGIYRGAGNRDLDMGGKHLTIRSIDPEDREVVRATVIDCEGSALERHRGFYFDSGEGLDSVVSGLTIEHGYHLDGGGIYCTGECNPTIRNCIIQYGHAERDGGGVQCNSSRMTLINCDIIHNTAGHYAGGIDCCFGSNARIDRCRISFNESGSDAGGLQACLSGVIVVDSIFEGNISGAEGGGMYCRGPCEISHCLFVGNQSLFGGGIFLKEFSNPRFIHCTVAGNRAQFYGGGFSGLVCNPKLLGCIIWGNTAGAGAEIAVDYTSTTGSEVTISYSCVGGGESGIHRKLDSIVHWGSGIITEDPLFFVRGYWDMNGTPTDLTDDYWVGGDYHLCSKKGRWGGENWILDEFESPCIDAGDAVSDWRAELWPHGGRVNMGAYGGTAEASMSLSPVGNVADLNHDGMVDLFDGELFGDKWLERELLIDADLNRDGVIDLFDWSIFVGQWLWMEEIS